MSESLDTISVQTKIGKTLPYNLEYINSLKRIYLQGNLVDMLIDGTTDRTTLDVLYKLKRKGVDLNAQ